MTRLEKLKDYMELCDIHTNKELVDNGGYPKTVQFLGQILNGQKNLSVEEEKLIYTCINVARAKRLMGE
ncbi:MAG: hypothetical protein PHS59_18115 [Paludibacter sp.]|nr:hypothetical protein [Paludibacter sp.]